MINAIFEHRGIKYEVAGSNPNAVVAIIDTIMGAGKSSGAEPVDKSSDADPVNDVAGWLARDRDGMLCVFNKKPRRDGNCWQVSGEGGWWVGLPEGAFPSVTWEGGAVWVKAESSNMGRQK